jgi:hypothetical protein
MTRVTQINKEEMEPIIAARAKAMDAAAQAEKTIKDAKMAELEFKVQIQQLYLAKGLDPNCRVDIANGTVAWPDQLVPQSVGEPEVDDIPKKKRAGRKPAAAVAHTDEGEASAEVEG